MRAIGIICEYDPFHRGHSAQIVAARTAFPDKAVICVMSGNFTQRGAPSLLRKHARAETAVLGGADLVIELPVHRAVAGAEKFAEGGVCCLAATGLVDVISFGSEIGRISPLQAVAELLCSPDFSEKLRPHLDRGLSFAAARAAAVAEISPEFAGVLDTPNNILGVEYIKAVEKFGFSFSFHTISRLGSAHNSEIESSLPSASLIRSRLRQSDDLALLPEGTANIFLREKSAQLAPSSTELLDRVMLAKLRALSLDEIAKLPDISEGLENRLYRAIRSAKAVDEVIEISKSKRYASSRLRRICCCAYLGITAEIAAEPPKCLRVLAANQTGLSLLAEMRETASVPVVTKPAAYADLIANEVAATDLYAFSLPTPTPVGYDLTCSPIIINK